jgi:hypothetical protein
MPARVYVIYALSPVTGTDEIKTVGKNSSSVTIPVFPLLRDSSRITEQIAHIFSSTHHARARARAQERSAVSKDGTFILRAVEGMIYH